MELDYFDLVVNAFQDGFLFTSHYEDAPEETASFRFQNQPIGALIVKSGQIGAADPFQPEEYIPFEETFPIGEFPVELSIVRIEEEGDDERIAFARIVFSQQPTTDWEIAMRESSQDDPTYFPVDSTTAGFFDAAVADKIAQLADDDEDWFNEIETEMGKVYKDTRSWYVYPVDDLNIAFFTAGLGDGEYRTYLGIDANGEKTQLVIDFGLFEADEKESDETDD